MSKYNRDIARDTVLVTSILLLGWFLLVLVGHIVIPTGTPLSNEADASSRLEGIVGDASMLGAIIGVVVGVLLVLVINRRIKK